MKVDIVNDMINFTFLSKIRGFNNYACWRPLSLKRIDGRPLAAFQQALGVMNKFDFSGFEQPLISLQIKEEPKLEHCPLAGQMSNMSLAAPCLPASAPTMSGAADNYEAVDMEESDGSGGSDNEAFGTKAEYKAYKQQFPENKVRMTGKWVL